MISSNKVLEGINKKTVPLEVRQLVDGVFNESVKAVASHSYNFFNVIFFIGFDSFWHPHNNVRTTINIIDMLFFINYNSFVDKFLCINLDIIKVITKK
ncbi:hypothetical protein DEM91_10145 [Prevotella sp. TCVGH]|nr:hypothetical protein [Prevotella sp. TCVGH]